MYLSPGGKEKDRKRFHARSVPRPGWSRERHCPNNGLESESSDFWRRPASDLSKVFFLLPPVSACLLAFSLPRLSRKKKEMFPWKLPPGYYGVLSRRLPPRRSSLTYLPPRTLRSAQPLTLSSSRASSILALFHVQVSLRFRQFSSNLRKYLLRSSVNVSSNSRKLFKCPVLYK